MQRSKRLILFLFFHFFSDKHQIKVHLYLRESEIHSFIKVWLFFLQVVERGVTEKHQRLGSLVTLTHLGPACQ